MIPEPDARTDAAAKAAVNAAIEVHRYLGPGLLESIYEHCLAREFDLRGIPYRRQLTLPVSYKRELIDAGYRIDLLVDDRVILEIKAVDRLLPIHDAQLPTYLRLASLRVGLLLNFNTALVKDGTRRVFNTR